jgi:nitrite reductase/ring-hydroxylating ferredoxin subunit
MRSTTRAVILADRSGAGDVYGTRVVCPLHGWEYDFTTGASVDDPEMRVACFAVTVEGDDVYIEI